MPHRPVLRADARHRPARSRVSRRRVSLRTASALALVVPLTLGACATAPTGEPVQLSAAHESTLSVADAWAKASSHDMVQGEGMTGVFGVLTNLGDADLVVSGVSSPAARFVEFHEVIDGTMRAISDDIVIPAGAALDLIPGGEHLMLMEMSEPILPGDDVTVLLEFTDGSSFELTAMVKDTAGANEDYGDLEHADHEHDDQSETDQGGGTQ